VLLVEDDSKLAELLRRWLAASGLEVVVAGTGDAALSAAANEDPDAIVLDIMIPHPDGLEVCRHLRSHGYTNPILAVTARGPQERAHAIAAGASDLLAKPIALGALTARLGELAAAGPWTPAEMF